VKMVSWRIFWRVLIYLIVAGLGAAATYWYLARIYLNDPTKFWSQAFLIIASIAAVFAGISALIANRSLELTRNTQRPFLNVLGPVKYLTYLKNIRWIKFLICNEGVFPAEQVSVRCDVFKNEDNAKNLSLELKKEIPSIFFPDEKLELMLEEKSETEQKSGEELHVLITISYKNKLSNTKHKTVRSYLMEFPNIQETEDNYLKIHAKRDDWD